MTFAPRGLVHVRTFGFIALDQSLLKHDLQGLQYRRIAGPLRGANLLPNLAHGALPTAPQDPQEHQLGVSRFGWPGLFHHPLDSDNTKLFVLVNENFRKNAVGVSSACRTTRPTGGLSSGRMSWALRLLHSLFPLTPALSLRERETLRPRWGRVTIRVAGSVEDPGGG